MLHPSPFPIIDVYSIVSSVTLIVGDIQTTVEKTLFCILNLTCLSSNQVLAMNTICGRYCLKICYQNFFMYKWVFLH
jgi:hypothetical protein